MLYMRIVGRSQAGFSILEALIMLGIVGVLASGISTLFSMLLQNTQNIDFKNTTMSETLAVQSLLMSEDACLNTFGAMMPAVPVKVDTIKTASSATFKSVNAINTPGDLRSMSLADSKVDPADFSTLTLSYWPQPHGYAVRDGSIEISVVKDANGKITRCSSYGLPQAKVVLANLTCPTGQAMQGFDANGNPVCFTPTAASPPPVAAQPVAVAPVSACGGTQPHGASVLQKTDPDGSGSFMGLQCGQATGAANQCFTCSAQWQYLHGVGKGNTIDCICH